MRTLINTPGQLTQAVIVPNTPAELVSPVQINSSGAVSSTIDPVQRARLHILSVAMTSPGERVMRPTYGAGILGTVFQPGNSNILNATLQRLQRALGTSDTESSYSVNNVQLMASAQVAGAYNFSVDFTVNQDPTIHKALFDFNGNFVGTT